LLEEANIAFQLNVDLFTTLKPPTSQKLLSNLPAPVLGDPESDIDDSAPVSQLETKTKEPPTEIIRQQQDRMVSLASVISVIAAVCLAHFLLVTGGFTGTAWIEKLKGIGLSVS
jgi:hypothetical protein